MFSPATWGMAYRAVFTVPSAPAVAITPCPPGWKSYAGFIPPPSSAIRFQLRLDSRNRREVRCPAAFARPLLESVPTRDRRQTAGQEKGERILSPLHRFSP